jgi:hypothetical protein
VSASKPKTKRPGRYRFQHTVLQRNDFQVVSAERGQPLEAGFQPRADLPPYPLAYPLDWTIDPHGDRNWRFQLHAWRMLNPVWRRFLDVAPDPALFDNVLEVLRDWHRAHMVEGIGSEYAWNDMATGLRAQHLALVKTVVDEGLARIPDADQAMFDALAREHVRRLRDPEFLSKMNHAIFQLHGLRLLCAAHPGAADDPGEETETSLRMRDLVHSQFGADAVHTEDSPFYHHFAVLRFRKIRPGLYPLVADDITALLAEAAAVTPWLTLPDGRFAAIGDSEGEGLAFPEGAAPPVRGHTPDGVPVIARDLCAGGYAIVRSHPETPPERAFMLIVSGSSWRGIGHDHVDELGFELFDRGRPLLVDSGKYAYEADEWRTYFVGDRSHNVAGLAETVFRPADTSPRGSALTGMSQVGGAWVVSGAVERGGVFRHSRHFMYAPGEQLLLLDQVESGSGEAVELRFHFHEDVAVELDGNRAIARREGALVATLAVDHADAALSLHRGESEPVVLGWRSPSYRERVPCTCLRVRLPTAPVRVATRITLGGEPAPMP